MAQHNSASVSYNTSSSIRGVNIPTGNMLADSHSRTLAPSMGALAFDSQTNSLYMGCCDTWIPCGSGGNGYTSRDGSTGVSGMSYTGSTGIPGMGYIGRGCATIPERRYRSLL